MGMLASLRRFFFPAVLHWPTWKAFFENLLLAGVLALIPVYGVFEFFAQNDLSKTPLGQVDESARTWLNTLPWYGWTIGYLSIVLMFAVLLLSIRLVNSRGASSATAQAVADNPASRVWTCLPYPVMNDIASSNRIGFCIPIHNGNTYPVKIGIKRPARILYGDRIVKPPQLSIEGLGEDAPALMQTWIVILIKIEGSLGDQIRADLERGTLQSIDIRELEFGVLDGHRAGRLRAPEGVLMKKKDDWTLEVPVFDFERPQDV